MVAPKNVGISRDQWVLKFTERLVELRPHLSLKLAWAIALAEYKPAVDPAAAAVAYHARQEPQSPAAPAKKRAK